MAKGGQLLGAYCLDSLAKSVSDRPCQQKNKGAQVLSMKLRLSSCLHVHTYTGDENEKISKGIKYNKVCVC